MHESSPALTCTELSIGPLDCGGALRRPMALGCALQPVEYRPLVSAAHDSEGAGWPDQGSSSCATCSAGATFVDCCHHQCSKSHAGGSTGGVTYTVGPGDTLLSIADTHNTTGDAIMAANPSITSITPGDIITLPTAA